VRRSERDRLAAELLVRHGIQAPPVPVEDIAVAENIQVVRSTAKGDESGFLLRNGVNVIIGVNSRNSPRRQRFTIAHELGHWRLHKGRPLIVDHWVMINKRDGVSSQATDFEEIEANQFAAELLMPRQFIKDSFKRKQGKFGSRDVLIGALATEFGVSVEAMGFRLTNLGMLFV